METILSKVLALLGILIFSILFGIVPIFMSRCVRSPKVQWLNNAVICFSGGTLLGISFLHLMPETRESVHALRLQGKMTSFPASVSLADTIIVAGFFAIYVMDELIHALLEWAGVDHSHKPHGRDPQADSITYIPRQLTKDQTTSTDNAAVEPAQREFHNIHIPGILTILALSFHDIFEGLALGIQEHNMDVYFLFLSVATHKFAIAFSVSLDFLLSGVDPKVIVLYTVIFSLVNPGGIGIGIALSLLSREDTIHSPMTVTMQGIASGSLIYVTCFEVLQRHTTEENGSHVSGIRNTVFVISGFIFMLGMKIVMGAHNHHFEEEMHGNSTASW
uniref:Zinc/iron permease n=1 Tax=Cuerna arida TaxID=1464854 RepID=A0A1B6FPY5_9HEMI